MKTIGQDRYVSLEIPGARMSCKMLRRLSEHHNVECDVQDFLHVSDNL
jgi:hypothetical protein